MGSCCGRRRAARIRRPLVVVEEGPQPWRTDPWSTERVWEGVEGAFNILAVYTSDCAYGPDHREPIPRDQLIDNIRRAIDDMNAAFVASQVDLQASLVAIVQFAVPEPWVPNGMYRDALLGEAADEQQREERLQNPTPRELTEHYRTIRDTTLQLRAQHRAHLVLFVTGGNLGDPIAGALGAANREEAFVTVPARKLLDEYTTAHEIGHVFGCEHDRDSTRVRGGASSYGYVAARWRTIMAYNPFDGRGARVIGYYSNPAVQHNDGHGAEATGADNANNAAQINLYRDTILGMRG